MAQVRGVLFDYGHTLVWFPRYGEIHLVSACNIQRRLRALGSLVEVSEIQELIDEFSHRRNGHVLKIDDEFRQILAVLGVKGYSKDDLREIIHLHWRPYLQDACVRKGAKKLLENLRSRGFKLGIVANIWSGGMNPALEKLDLERFFDTTVASVDVGFQKPDPRIFQLALDRLELAAEDAFMVGDNPKADIKPAHDLGMGTVRLLRGPNRTEPDIVRPDFKIRNISALAAVLSNIKDQNRRA